MLGQHTWQVFAWKFKLFENFSMKIVSYAWSQVTLLQGKLLQISNFHHFAAIAACNPPDIKCINAFREKAKLHFGRNTENWAVYFARCVNHSILVEFGWQSLSLHGKLINVVSCWLLKFFFLKSNDVLDVVLSTDIAEQLCFKFVTRRLVSLSKTKIICSVTDRKPSVACGFCGVKNSPVIG